MPAKKRAARRTGGNRGDASPTTPERVTNRVVDGTEAARLRAAGATFREIAQALDCSLARAHKLVTEQLDLVAYENAALMRTQEGERLDRLQRAYWADALGGDKQAAMIVLRVSERRSKLFGLDAPIVVDADVTVHDQVSRDALEHRLRSMRDRMEAIETTARDHDDQETA